ncbi:MAG: heavy metal-binding domain-containing protein [Lentisphaeria bacterium]|nr:heavy metal-binding domain-containing protein [Lentisphaeria bacterium]
MIIVNTETIPGMKIVEFKGLVQGNTVRADAFPWFALATCIHGLYNFSMLLLDPFPST